MSRTKETISDCVALLRAKTPIIWVVTKEEGRVEKYLAEAAIAAALTPVYWDCSNGFCDVTNRPIIYYEASNDAAAALQYINAASVGSVDANGSIVGGIVDPSGRVPQSKRQAFILRDFHKWVEGPMGTMTVRQLRNMAKTLPYAHKLRATAIIIMATSATMPEELTDHCTVIDWPLPDRADIEKILNASLDVLTDADRANAAPNKEAAIDAAIGLSGTEVASCYSKSLVQLRRIDPAAVAAEKKRVVSKEKLLEWHDPLPGGLDAVGGLENLKAWAIQRAVAYSAEAVAYGIPHPKGVLAVGMSGCGKSLFAKALATVFGCPLVRLDLNALKGKFVGQSEENIRKVFKILKALGRCVVWIDEIEKALQGATSGSADGGVSADALGSILSWMQDKEDDCFIVATANDVSTLPPELLRKGRFDEIFFVDLPTHSERQAVLRAALKAHGRAVDGIDLATIADATKAFTGAEIASLVPSGMFASFADGQRALATADLLAAASTVFPLANTAREKIGKLKEWAIGRARPASLPEPTDLDGSIDLASATSASEAGRMIDLGDLLGKF